MQLHPLSLFSFIYFLHPLSLFFSLYSLLLLPTFFPPFLPSSLPPSSLFFFLPFFIPPSFLLPLLFRFLFFPFFRSPFLPFSRFSSQYPIRFFTIASHRTHQIFAHHLCLSFSSFLPSLLSRHFFFSSFSWSYFSFFSLIFYRRHNLFFLIIS